jgi:hypothetical protein
MSNTLLLRAGGLAMVAALLMPPLAHPQTTPSAAPVPGQIIAAKRLFISNAGSESYGAEGYFRLTKYDGGPDRFYNQFYSAIREWGHYELTDAPTDADIVGEVRFLSPIVNQVIERRETSEPVYDPQLKLAIVDPKTRVTLWSLTEHIEPARSREGDNRNFDQAVARIVDRTRMLSSGTTLSSADGRPLTIYDAAPVGAIERERLEQRSMKIAGGAALGVLAGMSIGANSLPGHDTGIGPSRTAMLGYGVAGAVVGGLVGWLWSSVTEP